MSLSIRIPGAHGLSERTKNEVILFKNCKTFCCLNLNSKFMSTKCSVLKLLEIILGLCCELLLIKFGNKQDVSEKFLNYQSTLISCITTSFLLFSLYLSSFNTYRLIRKSLFVRIMILIIM